MSRDDPEAKAIRAAWEGQPGSTVRQPAAERLLSSKKADEKCST
jgi:hypothetical protein